MSTKLVDRIIDYEMGLLDSEDAIELFQNLIDSGMIYSLQGSYQRTARALIDAGVCHWSDE